MAERQPRLGPCISCGQPSSKRGEHVLPLWLAKSSRDVEGFFYEISGKPICGRDGLPRRANAVSPYRLPVCEDCNNELNRLYEEPAKCSVRAVLDHGAPLEASEQVAAFARWWIKTLLLLLHPAIQSRFPGLDEVRNPADLPGSVYKDLMIGSLPSDVSLWLAAADDANGRVHLPELLRIYLPTTLDPQGVGGNPATLIIAFNHGTTIKTRILLAQLVFHPLCDFEHPFERYGLVARLAPGASRSL